MKSIARALLVGTVLYSSAAFAQNPTTHVSIPIQHMLGPNSPARADTDGDGSVSPADANVIPSRSGVGDTSIEIANPWQVGVNGNNTINLSNLTAGKFATFTRTNNDGLVDVLNVTGLTGGTPSSFGMQHTGASSPSGSGNLLDGNTDGIFDGVTGAGGSINFNLNFVYTDTNGDGWADFLSIPWAQAQLVGVDFGNTIGGRNPQVWVPLADTNGDGRGDAIVPDLDGNDTPDSDLYASAPGAFGPVAAVSAANPVPTLSQWAMLLTLMMLTVLALLQLRRIQGNTIRL